MLLKKIGILVVFFTTLSLPCLSQKDTLFWFAAPDVSSGAGDNPVYLRFMSYDQPSTVTITQPANGSFLPINVVLSANDIDSVNLTAFLASIESPSANTPNSNGLKIVASNYVSAFYEVKGVTNHLSFSLKGNKGMGTNFYTPFQKDYAVAVTTPASFASFEVVATEDNTTVLITPRTAITGHAANTTYSVVLNQGQTYSGRDMNVSAATSLAGSIISANKKITVTVFEGSLSNGTCSDGIGDQLTTTDFIGNKYIIHKGTTGTEKVYILATQNATAITATNSTVINTLINWSETYTITLTDAITYIETTKPVYIYHVGGFGCELSAAQVPAVQCAGTYSTAFSRTSSDSLGIVLYTRTGFEDDFTLNGSSLLIPPAAFQVVPGTAGNYKVASIYFSLLEVPLNSYNLIENTGDVFGLGVRSGIGNTRADYSYLSEFASYPFVNAGTNATVCANVPFPLSGIVGGGSVTGAWSGSGFGTFQNGNTALVNNYIASPLDTLISPIQLILSSTGPCPVQKDTIYLTVTPSPLVNASANQTVCANNSQVQLNGSVMGGASTGTWSSSGTGSFSPHPDSLNAVYSPSPGDFSLGSVELVLTATGFGACNVSTDTMIVSFTSAAVVTVAADTLTSCKNNPVIALSGTVTGSSTTGKWTTAGNGIFQPNNLSLNCNYLPGNNDLLNNGVWVYLESTSNGSCIAVEDSVFLAFTPSPIVDAGPNQIICSNDTDIALAGTVGGATTTGVWSGSAGSYSPDNTTLSTTLSPLAGEVSAGTLVLTLTSTNNGNCNAVSDVVQISFVAPPFANFNFTEVCEGNSTTLTDFSLAGFGTIDAWEWALDDGNSSVLQDVVHQYGAAGSFDVQLIVTSSVGCMDTIVKAVDVFEAPVANFSYSVSCPSNSYVVQFTDLSTASDGISAWSYDFGGQGNAAVQNPLQLFNAGADYVVTQIVTSANGCKDTLVQNVNIPFLPEAGFYYNTTNGMNVGAVFNFIDTSSYASSYSWIFGNGGTSTLQNPSSTYFANGLYPVTLYAYNSLGCYDSTTTYFTINTVTTEIVTLIPNTITPNNDGKNDVWKLEFIDILFPDAVVEVYNQWGQQLFYSVGYAEPWDASFNGELVPDGNYFYVITLNAGLEQDQFKGALLVLKSRD
ncbi:MAG: PKD domain-containing protein [Bacteroidota bacterium]